jgi:O-antigen ligase
MPNLFFILVAALAFTYFCKKNILWGLGLIIIFLPSYLWRFQILSLPSTFLEVMIIILFFVWVISNKVYKKYFWKNISLEKKWVVLLLSWLIISFISWLFNPTIKSLGLWRAYFLEPLLFFAILISSLKNSKDYYLIIKAGATLIFGLVIFSIIQNFTGVNLPAAYDYPNVKRLTAFFSYPNALSLLTASLSGFLVAYYFFKQRKWEYLTLGILGAFLSWWSVSQGALLAMLFALTVVAFVKIYKLTSSRKEKKVLIAFIFSVLLFLFSTPMFQNFYQEIFHPVLDLQASSIEIRSSQWQETWRMLQDNWFSGAGLNAYQVKLITYHQTQWLEIFLYPHNIFLNFWTELGILGLLVFLLILYFIAQELKNLFLNKNKLAWPLLVFWLIWLIHGLVDVPYFKNDLSLLFFIFLALTIRAKDVDNNLQTKQILV